MSKTHSDSVSQSIEKALFEFCPHWHELEEHLDDQEIHRLRQLCGDLKLCDRFPHELNRITLEYSRTLSCEMNEHAAQRQTRAQAQREIHRPLKTLADHTTKALETLDAILSQRRRPTGRALMKAAATDPLGEGEGRSCISREPLAPQSKQGAPTKLFGDGSYDALGSYRLRAARYFLVAIDRWATCAASETKPPKNRPPDEANRVAVEALAELWERETGDWPSIGGAEGAKRGPFLDFCRAVLNPIREIHGLTPQRLTGLVDKLPSREARQKSRAE